MNVLLKTVCFTLLFFIMLSIIQPVFIVKREDGGIAFAQFYNEPRDSLDVLMLGSSGMYGGVLPAVLWGDIGVTSYNLAMSYMSAGAQYFLLREALRFQSPSVVIIEGVLLFNNNDFDFREEHYRQALDHMRLSPLKLEFIREIVSNSEKQKAIDYIIPLLRYHDRQDIHDDDYELAYRRERNPYMGAWFPPQTTFVSQTRLPELIESDDTPKIHDEYITKIIELCKEEGIEVILVEPPLCNEGYLTTARHRALRDFADGMGVVLFDFNLTELFSAAGFDLAIDFFNDEHVNLLGGEKLTRYIAGYLRDTYGFENKREMEYDLHWDDVLFAHSDRMIELFYNIAQG